MLNQPFFQITLPLMITFITVIWLASWSQNKRFEDLKESVGHRLDLIEKRLDNIEKKIEKLEERIASIELSKWR